MAEYAAVRADGPRSTARVGQSPMGHSPFLSRCAGVSSGSVEMVVPGDRARGDGGSGGGSDVQPERRFGSGSGARGRRGALVEPNISSGRATVSSPEVGSTKRGGVAGAIGGAGIVVGAVMRWRDDRKQPRQDIPWKCARRHFAGRQTRASSAGRTSPTWSAHLVKLRSVSWVGLTRQFAATVGDMR